MSRARHQMKRAAGGKATVYAGAGSNVLKEAEERRKGGRIHLHAEGEKAKERADRPKRARGGHVEHTGKVEHEHAGKVEHHHVRGRKRGGGIGANLTPLSTAAKIKEVTKGEEPEDMGKH